MKQIILFISCVMMSFASYSQAPLPVDNNQHQYVFAVYDFDNSQIFRLDTSSGELSVLKYKGNAEKSQYVKFQGCPNVPKQESYYGRFALLQHPKNYYVFVVDHTTGDTWQVSDNKLVKVKTAE